MTLLNSANKIYYGTNTVDKVYGGPTLVWTKPVAAPSASLLVSYTPVANRNDFTGEVGIRLGIGAAAIPVSWVGARCNGYGGTRTIKVTEWFSDAVVATAVIDYTGKALGEFAWASIPPLTLGASGYYSAMMTVTAGDGQWWSGDGATTMAPSIVNIYATYRSPGGAIGTTGINTQFVGLDLGW